MVRTLPLTAFTVLTLASCVKPTPKPSAKTQPEATTQGASSQANGDQTNTSANSTSSAGTTSSGTTAGTENLALTYPVPDPDLGESLQEEEIDSANKIAKIIDDQIHAQYAGKRAMRDAHPKTHGCVKAQFIVASDIKDEFAQGVFAKGSKYDAVVRFSNSSEKPDQPDITKDGRGMAFKLYNVPGKKLLDNEPDATTQDFIMISHPVFFMKDPKEYVTFIDKFQNSDVLSQAATLKSLGIQGTKIATDIKSLQIASPIQATYYSNVPYQLGVGAQKKAVKYSARPCAINGSDPIPKDTKDDNYLRTALIDHFKTTDACMDIYVQVRTSNDMSVEDSRIEWTTPWTKIATLQMNHADQNIAPTPDPTVAANQACDTLSFNPWHSLPEHKPLGAINRVRKIVYEHISKVRHDMNKEVRVEPAK